MIYKAAAFLLVNGLNLMAMYNKWAIYSEYRPAAFWYLVCWIVTVACFVVFMASLKGDESPSPSPTPADEDDYPEYPDPHSEFCRVDPEKCSFEGPFQCSACGGHIMLDGSFLEQISDIVCCPYCETICKVQE